jgi:hypothetical protein
MPLGQPKSLAAPSAAIYVTSSEIIFAVFEGIAVVLSQWAGNQQVASKK